MTDYEKFYWMLEMIPMSKDRTTTGIVDKVLEDNEDDLKTLAEIYTILQTAEGFDQPTDADYDLALEQVIKVLSKFNRGTFSKKKENPDNNTPPVGADATPTLIRKAIYFITYTKYAYEFGFDREVKGKEKVTRKGYQSDILERIKYLSDGKISLGHNTFTKWGLQPEADFVNGTYINAEMQFNYMGNKNGYLQFAIRNISDCVGYTSFFDLFGGGGSCSLARSYNPKVKEYINDFNIANVMFYMSLSDKNYYKEFKKACNDLIYEVEHPVKNATYELGADYWRKNILGECDKLTGMLYAMREDAELQDFIKHSTVENQFMRFLRASAGTLLAFGISLKPEDITKEKLDDYETFLTEQIKVSNSISSSSYRFEDYLQDFKAIKKTLIDKLVYNEAERDKIIYAMGKWYYFDALCKCIEGKTNSSNSNYHYAKHLLDEKYTNLSSSLLAGLSVYCIGKEDDLLNKILGYDVELAVCFFYTQHMLFKGHTSITGVTVANYNKFEQSVNNLAIIYDRFKYITPIWKDVCELLEKGSSIQASLCDLEVLKNTDPVGYKLKSDELSDTKSEFVKQSDSPIDDLKKEVELFKNSLVYLDSPYIYTEGYAGKVGKQEVDGEEVISNFDFIRYRDAVNNFIGQYMYSCRFSQKLGEDKKKEAAEIVLKIVKYYRGFESSAKYVCIRTDGVSSMYDFIKQNIHTDLLEVIFTNFDFTTPRTENMKKA
ncbi:MAG TPA: hypothetical protein DCE48_00865, partial [Lachnospiraceae bacterium]|uniref:hypothetical protein n=1 Tax=Anaerosporobacter sp. TaxID=1872529 RepID=UPI000EC34832